MWMVMKRRGRLTLEGLEPRYLLVGEVPTFEAGVFALPETANDLIEFDVQRVDGNGSVDDATTLVGFVTDDAAGSVAIRPDDGESYAHRALARARDRVVYQGTDTAEFKLKGAAFLSFGVIAESGVTGWLRRTTQLTGSPEVGFLVERDDHSVGAVRALGGARYELRWDLSGNAYVYHVTLKSVALEADLLVESFVNAQPADDPPGVAVETGAFVTRNYAVTNAGHASLVNVVLRDDNGTPEAVEDDFAPAANETAAGVNLGDLNGNSQLDPGEVWLYSEPTTAVEGQYSSEATVTATAGETPIEARDRANYLATTTEFVDLVIAGVTSEPEPFAHPELGDLYQVGAAYDFTVLVENQGNRAVTESVAVEAAYRDGVLPIQQEEDGVGVAAQSAIGAFPVQEEDTGVYSLVVTVDPADEIAESDDEANEHTESLTFVKPDVSVVDFFTVPIPLDRVEVGGTLKYDLDVLYDVRPVIKNTGLIPIAGPFEVQILYRDRTETVVANQVLAPDELLPLDPLEIQESVAGEYAITLVLDPNDQLDESNEAEDSNRFTSTLIFGE